MGPPRAARKAAIGSIAAEALGIPSAMIAAPGFVKQAKATAAAAGLAELRVAEYPGAFASHTREELLENTRKVLWPQVKSALTGAGPKSQDAGRKTQDTSPACDLGPATLDFESYDEFARVFLDSGWTDGLPVAPPTPERVAGCGPRHAPFAAPFRRSPPAPSPAAPVTRQASQAPGQPRHPALPPCGKARLCGRPPF